MTDFELITLPNIGPDSTNITLLHGETNEEVLINIKPPITGAQQKTRIICLLDRSQSMITPITYATKDGKIEDDGLTRMDLAIHTYKTLVNIMSENTEFGLISFNSIGKLLLPMTSMSSENKAIAISAADNIIPTGMTNLWEPLKMALDIFKSKPDAISNDIILMLTDGEPTSKPVRGEIYEMAKYINETSDKPPYFIPIGFTNEQDSTLLTKLANLTNEISYYISDASMMGTVFINTLSYLMTTCATNLILTIETDEHTKIKNTIKYLYDCNYEENKVIINIGSIAYGLDRNILIPIQHSLTDAPHINVSLSYKPVNSSESVVINNNEYSDDMSNYKNNIARMNFVSYLKNSLNVSYDLNESKKTLINGLNEIRNIVTPDDIYLKGIETDYYEAIKATDSKYFNKWGKHYVNALANAHIMERCTNFKDEGVKLYISDTFDVYRKMAETIFNDMNIVKHSFEPAHKISTGTSGYMSGYTSGTNVSCHYIGSTSPKIKTLYGAQRNYLNASNGCFAGYCMVTMGNNTQKRVDEIKKGDVVKSLDTCAKVKCVVKFTCHNKKAEMCNINGMIISPYHPIYINGRWQFPVSLAPIEIYNLEYVYDYVLETDSAVYINNIPACTFGHNLKHDIVRHQYFGTKSILNDLAKLNGWSEGLIIMPANCFSRNQSNMPVSGMKWNKLKHLTN